MVNYFWLGNKEEAARFYCNQHIRKIPSEVVQSMWVVIKTLDPDLYKDALEKGILKKPLKKDYLKVHMHPLQRWMALCRGNYQEMMHRCIALLDEYQRRSGKPHASAIPMKWLEMHLPNFCTPQWDQWYRNELKGEDSRKVPYVEWFSAYGYYVDGQQPLYVWQSANRNDDRQTHYAQIMNDDDFPGCRTLHDPVTAGRKHYFMKAGGCLNGVISHEKFKQPMVFLDAIPSFLSSPSCNVVMTIKKNIKKK